jgi:hypothetical protein
MQKSVQNEHPAKIIFKNLPLLKNFKSQPHRPDRQSRNRTATFFSPDTSSRQDKKKKGSH